MKTPETDDEILFSKLFENAGQPFCMSSGTGKIQYCNPAFCRLTGYTVEELQQMNWRQLTPAEWQGFTMNILESLRCTNEPQRYEKELLHKNGTRVPIESYIHHYYNSGKKDVIYYSFVTNITRRKKEREKLYQKALELQGILQACSDLYFKLEHDGTILDYKTGSITERCILPPNKLIGKKLQECISGSSGDKFRQVLNRLNTSRSMVIMEYDFIFNEKKLFYEASLLPLPNKQIIVIVRNITKRKIAEEKLQYISLHDPLTDLYNRAYFRQEMHRLENKTFLPVGIIFCDLDKLKETNDTFGHKAGDTLLVRTASVLKEPFRKGDTIARIGGDEFAVLLPMANQDIMEKACQRIQNAIEENNTRHPDLALSISVGYALSGETEVNMDELIKEADKNMYRNKILKLKNWTSS